MLITSKTLAGSPFFDGSVTVQAGSTFLLIKTLASPRAQLGQLGQGQLEHARVLL